MINWESYLSSPPTREPNRMLIPVNNFSFTEDDVNMFNEIYHYCLDEESAGRLEEFVLTPSRGICTKLRVNSGPRWQLIVTPSMIEILLKPWDARYYRFQIGHNKGTKSRDSLSGHKAFIIYKRELQRDGVDLSTLAIDNGEEVKKTIPSPRIELCVAPDRVYDHAYHLDLNSAYNAGMMHEFPILEPTIRRLYDERKRKPTYKNVLNMTQGFMQSSMVGYKYAHISRAGYVWTRNQIDMLSNSLSELGYRILAYNTDGIWYQSFTGDAYHDASEGADIGQWKTDHSDCKIRFKSRGCYEYIEDGAYTPVFRGTSSYERIVPRDQWVWGDIYSGELISYRWVSGRGIISDDLD